MKRASFLLVPVLCLLAASPLLGQVQEPPADTRPAQLMEDLSRLVLTAKRAVPEADGLFLDEDRTIESLYLEAVEETEVAVAAGRTTRVSAVEIEFGALTVKVAEGRCVLLIMPRENRSVEEMQLDELLLLARRGLSALFTFEGSGKIPKRPT